MEEDSALMARIASLSARINRHKPTDPSAQPQAHPSQNYHTSWVPHRGTPYGVPRGRGRGGWNHPKPAGYRHRSLVLNSPSAAINSSSDFEQTPSPNSPANDILSPPGWVTKKDRHMQLINNSVYEQKARQRTMAMEQTRQQKVLEREEQEKQKLTKHLHQVAAANANPNAPSTGVLAHHVFVNNIRFIVADNGSKLIKAPDESNLALATPKRATVGGVTFFRSRHGNLYRAGLVKRTRNTGVQKLQQLCAQFTSTGSCAKGPQCRYTHDPEKVTICREFLQTGKCKDGDDCDLSHNPTPERVPACVHFQRGNCTNPDCRYAHVKTSASAPVCRDFAILGYCSKGIDCKQKHVHECPDYTNKGVCRKSKCPLPHVDRAGQLRKAMSSNESRGATADSGASSDVSSDAELDSDDFDSEGLAEDLTVYANADQHELSQQVDYIEL